METLKHLDGPTFEADVLSASLPVVVDFYADWCPPCRMMTPALERLAVEFEGKVTIGKIDVDVYQDIAIQYGVMAMPTLALFKGGKMVDRMVGYPGSANPIREWIEKHVPNQTVKDIAPKTGATVQADVKPST
jgi:thioredoxin 1